MAKMQTQKSQEFDGEALAELLRTARWIEEQLTEPRILLRRGQISSNNGSSWEPCPWLELLTDQARKLAGDGPAIPDSDAQYGEILPAE